MHIGIDARLCAYRTGGISTYVRQLIAALEQIDTSNRYTILQSRQADTRLSGMFAEVSLLTPPHHRLERAALSAELLRLRLDLLHSPDFIPPWRGARRHVITIHDLTFLHYPQHKDAAALRYYSDQITYAVHHADHILAVSEATRVDLVTLLNVAEARITVQPNGVDARFRPLTTDEREALQAHLSSEVPARYILFVGTLEPRKNIPGLLDAYAALPADLRHEYALLLVGRPGWLFADTLRRIEAMQRDGYAIHMRSDIDDEALPAVYNGASLLVLPSFYEGFGLPMLEAMACGVPVAAADISSLPEVAGDAALLVDPHEPAALARAIQHALTDNAWRETAIQRGLAQAARFTWRRSAEIALSVYESLQ